MTKVGKFDNENDVMRAMMLTYIKTLELDTLGNETLRHMKVISEVFGYHIKVCDSCYRGENEFENFLYDSKRVL